MSLNFDSLLKDLREAFEQLSNDDPEIYKAGATAFAHAAGAVGRAIFKNPELRHSAALIIFVNETVEPLWYLTQRLMYYTTTVIDLLEDDWEWNNRWLEACACWSDGVFLRELYEETNALEFFRDFGPEDEFGLDHLESRGRAFGDEFSPEDIPDDIPSHHWWWWLPGKPPSNE